MSSSSRRRIAVIVVLALVAVVTVVVVARRDAPEPPVVFYGNVDIRDVSLAFRVGGRVTEVLKREGEAVASGDVLARLDPAPHRIALDQAKAAAAAARATFLRAAAGPRRQEIAEARAQLDERRAATLRANDTFTRTQRLFSTEAVTQQTLDNDKTRLDEAKASVQAAEATLGLLVQGTRTEDIAIAQAQLDQAEAAVAKATLDLEDTELRASSAGTVLTRALEPGAMVSAGSTVVVLSLDNPVWVRAFAPEPALGRLVPGSQVSVITDSRPDAPYPGHIGYVASQAEFTPKNVETADLRTSLVYRFRVVVDAPDAQLRQGMPVTIHLEKPAAKPIADTKPF